ncbi:MAG: helix-turn-helix domain-containing protein [Proteobacteria bacterium]|nr:helix-turn-helix domain-containing protein [Pseudomonadota bacterium]
MDQTSSLPRLLKEQEAAEILNMEVSTLRKWRWAGDGPKFIKIGAAVRYDPQALKDYIAERVRTSTSDVGPQSATA